MWELFLLTGCNSCSAVFTLYCLALYSARDPSTKLLMSIRGESCCHQIYQTHVSLCYKRQGHSRRDRQKSITPMEFSRRSQSRITISLKHSTILCVDHKFKKKTKEVALRCSFIFFLFETAWCDTAHTQHTCHLFGVHKGVYTTTTTTCVQPNANAFTP